ncbi:hypothetical protein CKO28_00135 [Rhodovibrio sodomensis]|uniref:NadR/Ttd14 AAA domain-containing protein n=1 Tax=Rhodovibrio sodomensis TaxID=1088 RepID=A0ABS1D7Q3_9PROT|nr:AAA family ATPase [Rhodovibrio sodomensis]MBK1666447.1 hypothetical protein [Rhodovibrio sodomensis]
MTQNPGPLVINVLAGPGAGKSTLASMIFAALKQAGTGWTVELAAEFAKDLVWEGRGQALQNQLYVLGEQYQRIHRVAGQAHIVVTDSPVLFSAIYKPAEFPDAVTELALWAHYRFPSLNVFVERPGAPYEAVGRVQTEAQAIEVDRKIESFIEAHQIAPVFRARPEMADAQKIADKAVSWVSNQYRGPRRVA